MLTFLEMRVGRPEHGLPDEVFYFVGRMTPYVNIDVIIRLSDGRIVTTWRDDKYSGKGWHIPGGIVRFRECLITRVRQTVLNEIGIELTNVTGPVEINEMISSQKDRSHFISLLYLSEVDQDTENEIISYAADRPGYFGIFRNAPKDLLVWHSVYEKYFLKD